MAHGYAVIDGYGVELGGVATHGLYLAFHNLANLVQVGVAGYKLRERVDHGYYGPPHLLALHACRNPQGARPRHAAAFGADCTS